ncbi:MAG: hypothetical protein ACRDY1_15715, partial [Acidimicrobiales bacterium]
IVATGERGLVDADFVRPGATVIDVGIHRTEDGITGDVVFDEVAEIADLITPVPGGVGPMTIAVLLDQTVAAAEGRRGGRSQPRAAGTPGADGAGASDEAHDVRSSAG